MKTKNKKAQKAQFGFYKFAFFPTKLTSGQTIWLKKYFIAGFDHGCLNRYHVNHTRYELLYESIN